ncbi:MAG: DUF1028 domain-containing protein [Granulosicoccus sp.]
MAQSCLNTYSIVGRCPDTGEVGAAVASAVPAVGAICLYLLPEVGAVSTQSWTNPYLATALLDYLKTGLSAEDAMARILNNDSAAQLRQIGAVGMTGTPAAWTGAQCTSWCGQRLGSDYAAQGNMLTGREVIAAMGEAFETSSSESLDERLMRSLEAAQAAGGDKRGRQSAAIKVMNQEVYGRVDLRVDEHADPIAELRRVLDVASHQLAPFISGMPKRDAEATAAPDDVVAMLMKSPPDRPGGGGATEP